MVLTTSQDRVVNNVIVWYDNFMNENPKQYYTYSGGPGTGKTTILRIILNRLKLEESEYIACAYSGKAVNRLHQTGLHASTIHSLIYYLTFEKIKDTNGVEYNKLVFKLKTELPDNIKLIIIDEVSMVPDAMMDEILSFGLPVLAIGDMDQIPPVFGMCSMIDNPDDVLTEIMRQAEDDPIVQLSRMALAGKYIKPGTYGKCKVVESIDLDSEIYHSHEQILTCTNKVRQGINNHVRKNILHYGNTRPSIGDKIICRQNNRDIAVRGFQLTNGMVGHILDIDRSGRHKNRYSIDFLPDFFEKDARGFENLKIDAKYIDSDYLYQQSVNLLKYEKFEYAYAITVHLSQGSEYNNVLFHNNAFGDYDLRRKLRYTAISRAKDSITICDNIAYK